MGRPSTVHDWITHGGSIVLVAVGVWILGSWVFTKWTGGASSSPALSVSSVPALESREERIRSVCERTRARVQRGGTVTTADVDGWLVELWFLRASDARPILGDPALDALLRPPEADGKRRLEPGTAPELAALEGPDTAVTVHDASLRARAGGASSRPGVRLAFSGRYVAPYFSSSGRSAYFRLASLVAERLGASHGALYARCAHESSHYLGSWFQGKAPPDTLTALIVSMGLFATVPHVTKCPVGDGSPYNPESLLAVEQATMAVTVPGLAIALRASGGVVTGRQGQRITVTFPFDDGNRASRASHASAQVLGLSVALSP